MKLNVKKEVGYCFLLFFILHFIDMNCYTRKKKHCNVFFYFMVEIMDSRQKHTN